ncbi:ROK family protein [Enterococcus sp. LJL120]
MSLAVFDIGGTFVKFGKWTEELTTLGKFPTPKSYPELVSEMQKVVAQIGDVTGIALSAPGAVNVKERRIDGISAVPFIHEGRFFDLLEADLNLPVAIENDANCAGICEMELGAGKDSLNSVFVVIGTGIGGAIFIDGKLYKGAHLFGGEFGMMKNANGETLSINGTAVKMAARYEKATGEAIDGVELFARYDNGEELALEIINSMYDNITDSLYDIQVVMDPEKVILGGGISARPDLAEQLSTRLEGRLKELGVEYILPEIATAQYQNDANLIGAALNYQQIHG